jgi:hypothetical protein
LTNVQGCVRLFLKVGAKEGQMKIEIATKELPGGGFKGIVKGSIGTTKVWHYTPCFNTATAAYEAK